MSSSSTSSTFSESSESSSSSSEIGGTMLSFSTEGVVWNKSKLLSTEIGAVSDGTIQNRLAQTVGVNSETYVIGSVSLYLRERQGDSSGDINIIVDIYEADLNGYPTTIIASSSKNASEITWTGWHTFDFSLGEREAPASKFISIVFRQEGGDESNYISWMYAYDSLPGASALYSSDGGLSWTEHDDIVRLVRVVKSYNPFLTLCSEGILKSSVAEKVNVNVNNFNTETQDGGAIYSGVHNGTSSTADDPEHLTISNKNLIASIVVDSSGSMGWNDRSKNKVVVAKEIVSQIQAKYPGTALFDFIKFGSSMLGTSTSGGGTEYATIQLDPNNPSSIKLNNDGTTPSLDDGIIASGFLNLEESHTYIFQSVTNGTSTLFNGSGIIEQNIGVRVTENVQSVGTELLPIRLSVQSLGTGSESETSGTSSTVAEVPDGGSSQIRKPTVTGRILNTSSLSDDVLSEKKRIKISNPSLFESGETIDIIDANGVSCSHLITAVGDSFIDFTPATTIGFGSGTSSLGGFAQQTSAHNVIYIDSSKTLELLVKDSQASEKITFYVQTPSGGELLWDFTAMKEWSVLYFTYIDQPFSLVTYITDEDGDELSSDTKIRYYIDSKPSWNELSKTTTINFETPVTIEQGSDTIPLSSVSGISNGYYVTLLSSSGAEFGGYVVVEVDDIDLSIRISPPVTQETFQLIGIIVEESSDIDTESQVDMTFSGIEMSQIRAGRIGGNRLLSDPPQIDPLITNINNINEYNEEQSYWLNGSFDIPTISSSSGYIGYADLRLLPVTDDKLNTIQEEELKVSSIFNNSSLTDEELAELNALEYEYAQSVENQPSEVNIISEDISVTETENIESSEEWILSPQYVSVGKTTKFTSLATDMELFTIEGKTLSFDLNSTSTDSGLLAKEHTVYPTVNIMDGDNVSARYLLESYPVYFASPVQIFSQTESGKTVTFELLLETPDGYQTTEMVVPGVFAAGGESIRLDYIAYNRGAYVDGSTIRIKIYDAFRTSTETQFEPWSKTPELASEFYTDGTTFSSQTFNRLSKYTDGSYVEDLDMPCEYSEAIYLDDYESGGFTIDIIDGRASFTIPAIDVVTRLIVKAEVICPDNTTISCTRVDSIWIKNPISMNIVLPGSIQSGLEEPTVEGKVIMKCFDEIVPNNVQILLNGSTHEKYNSGDDSKVDPSSDEGIALTSISSVAGYGTADDNVLEQNYWPATSVKPSIGKTIQGKASGYMIGPHGLVTMHSNKEGELEGDYESFIASSSYQPTNARGAFSISASKKVEWISDQTDIDCIYIYTSMWKDGDCLGDTANCYADGWDSVIVLADIAASKNRYFEYFDEQWLSDDLLGISRSSGIARPVVFSANECTKTNLPGRLGIFYATRPTDPSTGNIIGELDYLIDGGTERVGWAGMQIGKSAYIKPDEREDSTECKTPWCSKIEVTSSCTQLNGGNVAIHGCASESYSGCVSIDETGAKTYTNPKISWIEPLSVKFWLNGKIIEDPFNVIRDGNTSSEIWVDVQFSGEMVPLVARRHDVCDSSGAPKPMPTAYLDVYYLKQTWDNSGDLLSSEKFRDGTISLTEYSPVASICRTTTSEGHYHSCSVDDVTGDGSTTGTFSENSIIEIEDHVHAISNFIVSNSPDKNGTIHSHSPLSVAVTKLNPITNNTLNICMSASVSYDASKTSISRSVSTTMCTQLEWFDIWEMNLGFSSYALAQEDVLKNNDGFNILTSIQHKVDGEYVPVEDGIRVSFNIKAYDQSEDSGSVQTFDLSTTSIKSYVGIVVSATAYIDGKVLTTSEETLYRSSLQWSPCVKSLVDEPTNDSIYIDNVLNNISDVKGASKLYDAIVLASDRINIYKADNPEWSIADKAIFILTDGCENLSERTISQVVSRIKMLTNGDRTAFVAIVLFGNPCQPDIYLAEKLKQDTGGVLVRIPVGYDPLLIPSLIESILASSSTSFNSGSYTGTIDIGSSVTTSEGQSGLCKTACVNIDMPSESAASLSVRFSSDNDDWTSWSDIESISSPQTCINFNDKFRYMQYVIRLYGNSNFESPVVSEFNVSYLQPSSEVIFLQPISVDMNIDEYVSETLVTHSASIPEGGCVKYGSVNNNTTSESDYGYSEKPWFNANERSIILTRMNETTYAINQKTYKAINGAWPDSASVDVYVIYEGEIDGQIVSSSSYTLNNTTGTVSFASALEDGSRVVMDIKPDEMVRVAVKMENYSETPIEIGQLTVLFNKTKRFNQYSDGTIKRHPITDEFDNSSSSSSESS